MRYIAYNLTADSRERVLALMPPRFANVFCEHVTYLYGAEAAAALPPLPRSVSAYAYSSDDEGVEALLVAVDGQTLRSDGKPYHLTLSLAEGRRQADSNTVIAQFGSKALSEAIEIEVTVALND